MFLMTEEKRPENSTDELEALKLYSTEKVAEILGVTPRYVRDLIYSNKLKSVKMGSRVRIRLTDLQEFIKDNIK